MGTQQLLLVVLGVIVVGVAVMVAIIMFDSNSQGANRDAIISDLENRAASALQYYRKPTMMAGGGYSYLGYALSIVDTGNANGSYSATLTLPSGTAYVPGNMDAITTPTQTIYLVGCGTETGDDGASPVKAFMKVSQDSLTTVVLN